MTGKTSEAHNELGIRLADKGWLDEAAIEFKKAIDSDQDYSPAYDNLANIQAERGELLNALKTFLTALDLNPNDPTTQYNLGCFLTNHAGTLAKEAYLEATKQEPNFPEAYLNLARNLSLEGQYAQAALAFKQALKLNPNFKEAWLELAECYQNQGFQAEAKLAKRKARALTKLDRKYV